MRFVVQTSLVGETGSILDVEGTEVEMRDEELLQKYNYDEFVPEKFSPWMRFDESPSLGSSGPDFSLWDLNARETSLSQIWSQHDLTIVEFGSFT